MRTSQKTQNTNGLLFKKDFTVFKKIATKNVNTVNCANWYFENESQFIPTHWQP
jgi:hypothetical protein